SKWSGENRPDRHVEPKLAEERSESSRNERTTLDGCDALRWWRPPRRVRFAAPHETRQWRIREQPRKMGNGKGGSRAGGEKVDQQEAKPAGAWDDRVDH